MLFLRSEASRRTQLCHTLARLGCDPGWLDDIVRAKRPERLPVVLTRQEVQALLAILEGFTCIVAMVLYGSGVRLMECLWLRVKDIDFTRHEIVVREAKATGIVYMLPAAVVPKLRDVKTTMVYTYVLNQGGRGVQSPADDLPGPPGRVGR